MAVTMKMRPDLAPLTRLEFGKLAGPYSIALDGFVKEGPWYDASAPMLNLNHHEGVDRLATLATCAQALRCARLGLYRRFRDGSGPRADVYMNDCDEDVCAAWFVLSNPDLSRQTYNPAFNRMVGMIDELDSSAGAYPLDPDSRVAEELAWIFQPYRRFRSSGGIDRRNTAEFTGIVTDVCNRMMEYVAGRGERIALDTRYEKIGGSADWAMIREIGEQGRIGAFRDGIEAYVIVRERSDGARSCTFGRISQFIDHFPVPEICAALTAAENTGAVHGGGNTIGGTDRVLGTRQTIAEITEVIESVRGKHAPIA
ncbi:hypothetical protein HY633_04835 [Candidatus Uhrbacteria bacterium]|nr:hypothetical protein [Candidatus Uhrbacteria bacterium]